MDTDKILRLIKSRADNLRDKSYAAPASDVLDALAWCIENNEEFSCGMNDPNYSKQV